MQESHFEHLLNRSEKKLQSLYGQRKEYMNLLESPREMGGIWQISFGLQQAFLITSRRLIQKAYPW
ncbi:hypothetical protein BHQ29_00545 [Pseudomonas sp. LPH1]|nr:hypothetical protein BHQ29_00545 [Pseudomonas sp. LPH1]